MMPMPPSRASAIASRASVTVSIAADAMGMLSVISVVNLVAVRTSPGSTYDSAGSSNTSSKVRPSLPNFQSQLCSAVMVAHTPLPSPALSRHARHTLRIQKAPSATRSVVHWASVCPAYVGRLPLSSISCVFEISYHARRISVNAPASVRPLPQLCKIVYDTSHVPARHPDARQYPVPEYLPK